MFSSPNDSLNQSNLSLGLGTTSLRRSRIEFDQRASSFLNIKPVLTGSYAIDEELHSVSPLITSLKLTKKAF